MSLADTLKIKTALSNGVRLTEQKGRAVRENLKNARKAAGLTQQTMADKVGLTLNHYQKIEYEKLGGSFEVWDALEDLLGVHQRILRDSSDIHPGPKGSQ